MSSVGSRQVCASKSIGNKCDQFKAQRVQPEAIRFGHISHIRGDLAVQTIAPCHAVAFILGLQLLGR
jgi:hypothetical protein